MNRLDPADDERGQQLPAYSADVPPDQRQTVVPGGVEDQQGVPDALLIRTRDGDKRFDGSKPVTIGRDRRSDVVAGDSAVSRHHADVQRRAEKWWYVDRSTSGSFIDGERVNEKEVDEEITIQLGHPSGGYQVTLIPVPDVESAQKDIAGKRWRRRGVLVAAAIAVVVLVAGVIAASVLWPRAKPEQPGLSAANLERAKKASVQILAYTADGRLAETGSGSIISPDGLILTNNHVADPTVMGAPADLGPWKFQVAFAKDDATPAAPKYQAIPLVQDSFLDLAVMKINAKADGSPLEGGKPMLPEPLPIGDSNALRTGDRVTALGYPALTMEKGQHAGPLTITSGDVSSFRTDLVTGTERFWIDSTERLGSGNSGGGSINNAGELIGVNSQVLNTSLSDPKGQYGIFSSGSSLIRPVALAADVIRIAQNGGDPKYVSSMLAKVKPLPADATVKAAGWEKVQSKSCTSFNDEETPAKLQGVSPGDTVYAKFQISGIPDGTPLKFELLAEDQKTAIDSLEGASTNGTKRICVGIDVKVGPSFTPTVYAVLSFGYQGELKAINPVSFDFS